MSGIGTELSHEHIAEALSKWENYISFKPTEMETVLDQLPHKITGLFFGNQAGKCLTYPTLIDTIDGEVSIGKLYERGKSFDVYSWDGNRRIVAKASPPFKKTGLHKCYRITMSDGRWVEAADHHRILLSDGRYVSIEVLFYTYSQSLQESSSGTSRSVHDLSGQHYGKTVLNFQDHCFDDPHQYDEPPLSGKGSARFSFPLQDGVPEHNYRVRETGDLVGKCIYNLFLSLSHLSNLDAVHLRAGQFFGELYREVCSIFGLFPRLCLVSEPQCEAVMFDLQRVREEHFGQKLFSLASDNPSSIFGNQIVSFNPIGCQEVFDTTVPGYHNYIAGGLIHHNTSNVAKQYTKRLLGSHPIADKNRLMKKVRCMSSTLPESSTPDEQDNTQYIELKKLLPYELIEKDITARSQNLVVRRPVGLSSGKTIFEFRSSKQELQDVGKIQLSSVWHDEETPKRHREECKMRLLAEDGDEIFSLTPINYLSYTFDDVWQQAAFIFRTKRISEVTGLPQVEHRKTGKNIACIQAATDDNPTLDSDAITRLFDDITDPDELAIRRYAIFKQISGRVIKSYDPRICYISFEKYFRDGVPMSWTHARGLDYHESRIPWSVLWVAASPSDEWFCYKEFHPAIDGPKAYNTHEIAKAIARKSGDYYFQCNLIDPLANKKQPNTLFSATDDLNRCMDQLRKDEGIGTPTFWQGWDTKGTTGLNEIMKRFKNSVRCGVPFNNRVKEKGQVSNLPTLWIVDTCPEVNKSLLNWKFGEWQSSGTIAMNDPKSNPQQKFSHDCRTLECLAKDQRLLFAAHFAQNRPCSDIYKKVSITGR